MRSINSVQFLLLTQVVVFVKGVDFHHTHLGYCGIPKKRDSVPDTCKEYTYLDNFHTICRTEETSQLPFCAMSSEDQTILAGGDQHGGSNDDEVVSKYFTKKENLNSDGDTVGPAAEKVNLNVDITDPTLEQVASAVHVDQTETFCEEECPKEMATELNDSLPGTLENPELETTTIVQIKSSNEELQTPEAVDFEAKTSCDTDQSLEKVNSNVDTTDHTIKTPYDAEHVDQMETNYEEECLKEMANGSLPETLENSELETNMNVQTKSSNEEVQTSEAVDFEAKTSFTTEQSLEQINSNVGIADHTVEKSDDAVHIDQMENICEGECPKEMATEQNGSFPETPENTELETNLSVQTKSLNEEVQIPAAVDLEAKTNFDTEQSCDTEATTVNIEDLGTSEGQINYTSDDSHSPESECDMEGEICEEDMSANADNEEVDDFSASSSKVSGWKKKGQRNENKNKSDKSKLVKRPSDRDTENYRNGYPGQEDDKDLNDNIMFYKGKIPSSPDGAFIDDIHKHWKGNYELLERHHGYIQWLFPIRESGMNWQAQPLQLHEAKAIIEDPKASKRVLESYKLMLDFYGMQLVDEKTGELKRSKNWKRCFDNLNWSSHNFLRITRILKCLGELGYEHLKKNFIKFVLVEALEHHTLKKTVGSCRDYWIGTLKCDQDREELYDYIDSFESKNIR
ncbi:hypothetical protein BsWGS_08329 [Bradybaena similaris]